MCNIKKEERSRIAQLDTHYNNTHSKNMHGSDALQEKRNENASHCAIHHTLHL